MNVKAQLNDRIAAKSLLKHPFYQSWESGDLPVDALRTYARVAGKIARNGSGAWTRTKILGSKGPCATNCTTPE